MRYRGSPVRPSVPKPYDFVPIADVAPLEVHGQDRILFDDDHFSGRLSFEILALSPLFVSNGRYSLSEDLGFETGMAMRGFYRLGGRPALPASSVKGVVRHVAEAVSPSCVTLTRMDTRQLQNPSVVNTDKCRIGSDGKGKLYKACPACALFGGGGNHAHIGMVRFEDALLETDGRTQAKRLQPFDDDLPSPRDTQARRLQPLYAPRASFRRIPKVYLDHYGKFKGHKFYYHGQTGEISEEEGDLCEVVPVGARLTSSLSFINLDASLLGVLLFALGLDGTFKLKLGGGKPACFGSIEFLPVELRRDRGEGFSQAERSDEVLIGEAIELFIRDKIAVAESRERLLKPQMTKLREILRFPNSRECPTGMY